MEKLNKQNAEQSQVNAEAEVQRRECRGDAGGKQEPAEQILKGPHSCTAPAPERKKDSEEKEEGDIFEDSDEEENEEENLHVSVEPLGEVEDEWKHSKRETEEGSESEQTQSVISKER